MPHHICCSDLLIRLLVDNIFARENCDIIGLINCCISSLAGVVTRAVSFLNTLKCGYKKVSFSKVPPGISTEMKGIVGWVPVCGCAKFLKKK